MQFNDGAGDDGPNRNLIRVIKATMLRAKTVHHVLRKQPHGLPNVLDFDTRVSASTVQLST